MPSEVLSGKRFAPTPVPWRSAPPASKLQPPNASEDAEQERARRIDQARREGFASGVAAARQEAEQKVLPHVQALAASAAELARSRDFIREQAAADLVQLAISIASRVLQREVAVDPDELAGLLRAGFSKARAEEISSAKVSPALEPMVRRCLEQRASSGLILMADASLKPGDLVFETGQGSEGEPAASNLSEIDRGLTDKLEK